VKPEGLQRIRAFIKAELDKRYGGKEFRLPDSHRAGMKVPKGGSSCANCKFLKDAEKRLCGSPEFVAWNGSSEIPGQIDAYCSDWFEPKE